MFDQCPCGLKNTYKQCCQRLHDGQPAETAEALMRSRYSAYVLGLAEYLRLSWHPSTRPNSVRLYNHHQWLGLRIKRTELGQINDTKGLVEFSARYKINGKAYRIEEVSQFLFEDNHWFYLTGN